jgi:3',5'-cyclic AMP phosphodiesterase CpdA
MSQRRDFLRKLSFSAATGLLLPRVWEFSPAPRALAKPSRFGIISDLHHMQWGSSEEPRLKAFMDAVLKTPPDFIIQCGDFCRPVKSDGIMREWNRFAGPKYHVLGNHDMDVCDKATIMKLWGMEKRYYAFDQGGFHFVVMDRNFLRGDDGSLTDYASSNWGPLPSPKRSFSDKAQLDWLRADLAAATNPVVVFMHQPVFISDFFDELGNADEILAIFDEANYAASKSGRPGRVTAVFMGHDHDDRYGERNEVHYFLLNSSTYVYTRGGAYFYTDALFAFVTLDPAGRIVIEGRSAAFRADTPEQVRAVFSSKISDRNIRIGPQPKTMDSPR